MAYDGEVLNENGLLGIDLSEIYVVAVSGAGPNVCGAWGKVRLAICLKDLSCAIAQACQFMQEDRPGDHGLRRGRQLPLRRCALRG